MLLLFTEVLGTSDDQCSNRETCTRVHVIVLTFTFENSGIKGRIRRCLSLK